MSSKWTEHHSAYARLSAEKCSDRALLGEAAEKIRDDIDVFHEGECNLLFHASLDDNLAAMEVLLDHGANPAARDRAGLCLISVLMRLGQTEMAEECVDSMNAMVPRAVGQGRLRRFFRPNSVGWTPLMTAAKNGRMNSVIWLVTQGTEFVDINAATTSQGLTAADEAAKAGYWDIVKFLQECGASYNSRQERALRDENVPEYPDESEPLTTRQEERPPKRRCIQQNAVDEGDQNKRTKCTENAISVTEEQEYKMENTCLVCMERPSKTAMVPCGHASYCEECARRLKSTIGKCAVCRTDIQIFMNIYYS